MSTKQNFQISTMLLMVYVMALLLGCEQIKDATSRDIHVKNVKLDFAATMQNVTTTSLSSSIDDVTTRAGETSSFTVTRTVNISELGNADVVDYYNRISKVAVNSALITVTATPTGAFTVTKLTVTADGVGGSLVVPSYTIGDAFTAPAEINNYTAAFIKKLISTKSISVTITGQSDAPAGTVINICYESDLVVTASLL